MPKMKILIRLQKRKFYVKKYELKYCAKNDKLNFVPKNMKILICRAPNKKFKYWAKKYETFMSKNYFEILSWRVRNKPHNHNMIFHQIHVRTRIWMCPRKKRNSKALNQNSILNGKDNCKTFKLFLKIFIPIIGNYI